MNDQPNPAEFALAMYATACESHMRRDWREACHALAKALKAEQLASASRATLATAAPMPEPVAPAVKATPAVKRAKATKGAEPFDMMAGSLAKALRIVCRAVEKRSAIPIIQCVLIEAAGDTLTLTSTDMDRMIRVHVQAPGVGRWSCAVDAFKLRDSMAKAPAAADVTLTSNAKESRLDVMIGHAGFAMPTRDADDFPILAPDNLAELDLDYPALVGAVRFVSPAISTEETRYYLNGVFLGVRESAGERRLHVVTTDGHRLHKAEIAGPDCLALDLTPPDGRGAILPRRAVADLLAIAGDGEGLSLAIGSTGFQASRGPVTLTSKLIDGSFPDYGRVIPASSNFTVRVDRSDLASKVAGVASVATVKDPPVSLTAASDRLTLQCRDLEGGNASDSLDAAYRDSLGFESREWGFNAAYVKEALASLDGDTVTLSGTAPSDPFKVTGDDPSRLVVLMPLRV